MTARWYEINNSSQTTYAPTFTADTPPAATVGSPYSYQFQASGTEPITFSATGLPGWAQLELFLGHSVRNAHHSRHL